MSYGVPSVGAAGQILDCVGVDGVVQRLEVRVFRQTERVVDLNIDIEIYVLIGLQQSLLVRFH